MSEQQPNNKWYTFFKQVAIGPFLKLYNRPTVTGMEHMPTHGGAVVVSNHLSVFDSFYLPLLCPRQITFLAKQEYFTGTGIVGTLQRWFFTSVGQVPIDRTNSDAAVAAINTAIAQVEAGKLVGIYPEGTRSPDGRLYKGKTGAVRVALATGAPLVPVAMIGTRQANPQGSWILRPSKVRMVVGAPIDPVAFCATHELAADPEDRATARALTDEVMHRISEMSGQPYVDVYAQQIKASLAAGEGYPEQYRPTQQ
ncbi:lysophospholipid acyltransferase family protein [Corynebacterium choanae]|uniref:lysophospholipid acyltransferase family protein n=1 Tax=Corynebacterium choanae TaxID=1862358 RepID=UPI001FE8963F|nr:lysophospholipid acyltransferase family protein [Corynebacterium choanae]